MTAKSSMPPTDYANICHFLLAGVKKRLKIHCNYAMHLMKISSKNKKDRAHVFAYVIITTRVHSLAIKSEKSEKYSPRNIHSLSILILPIT